MIDEKNYEERLDMADKAIGKTLKTYNDLVLKKICRIIYCFSKFIDDKEWEAFWLAVNDAYSAEMGGPNYLLVQGLKIKDLFPNVEQP